MTAPIDFYFDFSSPYGYLAAQRIEALGAAVGRAVVWRPFLLGVVFQETGSKPLNQIPLKGDYATRDFARMARRYGVPYVVPPDFPFHSVAPCRAFYSLCDQDPVAAKGLAKALYHAAFGTGRRVSKAEVVAEVAGEQGLDADAVRAALQAPAVKERLRNEVEAARAAGVFGSPFFIVEGEPFWGQDRLADLEAWIREGGW